MNHFVRIPTRHEGIQLFGQFQMRLRLVETMGHQGAFLVDRQVRTLVGHPQGHRGGIMILDQMPGPGLTQMWYLLQLAHPTILGPFQRVGRVIFVQMQGCRFDLFDTRKFRHWFSIGTFGQ